MTALIHVVNDGPPDAPPLLLIHGSGASGGFWAPMIPALAAHHRLIRVDLPGHGRSAIASSTGRPGNGRSAGAASYAVPHQADRLAETLDAIGTHRVSVATHSSGGYIATALATRRPGLISSLTLISCGPTMDAALPEPPILRLLLTPPAGPVVWKLRTSTLIRRGIAATCARPIDPPGHVVADLRRIRYRTLRQVLDSNTAYLTERGIPDRLAPLGLPIQAIFGDSDPRWDPASVQQYRAVPGARIDTLPGVGHIPMLEAPGETAGLLLAFTTAQRLA
ncbi:alpha/beta hydrolase [Actinoplanes lobatus]|uniref:Alpha/beta hydrolase n=1 Tax=Actinoplanes lobatus TaxID=113568 RepID=A0A7W7HM48_9ACTN|nr:alpha/beta fold hydrolase [Actinoplanes lobatus]MBB4752995.1 pimeloyl-ACP methyl ester carboxylesterase [Actinoplanes lobatus]GGN87524.1 alpha/beta hydrolase [Actinoplanes lobatus]GIE39602.1 alpha/beta hydrolase [Actinoplanes lobatus]